jgi:hypothetical protein
MVYKKSFLAFLLTLLLAAPLVARAAQEEAKAQAAAATEATAIVTARSPFELLTERLAGARASGEARPYGPESLAELAADKAAVYREYDCISAASREYEGVRVDIFQMKSPYSAFGLFTYTAAGAGVESLSRQVGSEAAPVAGGLVFWKGNYFVRLLTEARKAPAFYTRLAAAIAAAIPASNADLAGPPLLDSLPAEGVLKESHRYFLGPESFGAYFERARDAFSFEGSAEAVMAEYAQGGASAAAQNSIEQNSIQQPASLRFFIIEYHTPNFATDAMAQAGGFIDSLPAEQRERIMIEREGNFIVGATNVADPSLPGV